jgi:hypothetical protein
VMLGQSSSLTEQQQVLCMGLMPILTSYPGDYNRSIEPVDYVVFFDSNSESGATSRRFVLTMISAPKSTERNLD